MTTLNEKELFELIPLLEVGFFEQDKGRILSEKRRLHKHAEHYVELRNSDIPVIKRNIVSDGYVTPATIFLVHQNPKYARHIADAIIKIPLDRLRLDTVITFLKFGRLDDKIKEKLYDHLVANLRLWELFKLNYYLMEDIPEKHYPWISHVIADVNSDYIERSLNKLRTSDLMLTQTIRTIDFLNRLNEYEHIWGSRSL